MAAHPNSPTLIHTPGSLSASGAVSETLIMSDCVTDRPDIHNKDRREREREKRDREGGEKTGGIFF